MVKKYKNDVAASVHQAALGLYRCGGISEQRMREYDEKCYATPVKKMTPKKIQSLRKREQASQAEFANVLNVSEGSVKQWESGQRQPAGAVLKLLALIEKNGLHSIA